jgi:cytochrome c-type biogenesis protein CcmF
MTEINFIVEDLLVGNLGKFFIYLAIIAGIASLIFYILCHRSANEGNIKFKNFGRASYYIQTMSVLLTGAILFYLIINHNFEYAYVYKHSSLFMPAKFIISCFWAGQEGSFLLWAIFISLFGIAALHTSKKLEGGVMIVVSTTIMFLMSMVLGLNVFGIQLGNDPFILLREIDNNASNEFFKNPDYLRFISDGVGLNPLLENPWMVIHPPVLFMGYASTLFPFAYAFSSLLQNDRRYWLKLTIPWVLISMCFLGAGLILGGAWAYQSLTFGGFWAWDPVENASLVPWLVLVAALHFMLLSYKRDKFYRGTYLLSFLSFVMVIYASYLTRSGVLGETSVHAFGDNGLNIQLLIYMSVFIIGPAWLFIKRRKDIQSSDLNGIFSREFLMLYGAIIILLSAFQVISTTSLPVFNKIFGTKAALDSDVVGFYNNWQLPFAMIIAFFIALGHYVKFDKNNMKSFFGNISWPAILALIITYVGYFIDGSMKAVHVIFLFFIIFAILSSIAYIFRFTISKSNISAGITHLGFSLFLLGVLVTFSNTETLSSEKSGTTSGNNVILYKGQVKQIGNHLVNFSNSRIERDEIFYQVDFLEKDSSNKYYLKYSVYPSVKYNERMGNVHNPDTRNLLKGDIFMYLTFAEDFSMRTTDGYSISQTSNITLKDTIEIQNVKLSFDSLNIKVLDPQNEHILITALLSARDSANVWHPLDISYLVRGNMAESGVTPIPESPLKLRFDRVGEVAQTIQLSTLEKQTEFIVLKIMFFPWIILVWTGAIVMFIGILIGIKKRVGKAKLVV